jgi:hypothetical protein
VVTFDAMTILFCKADRSILHISRFGQHLIDSAAVSCSITLIYSTVELFVLGISALVSLRARAILIIMVFLGLGSALARARDLSLRLTGVFHSGSEVKRTAHDVIFNIVVNALFAPLVYGMAGATLSELLNGTVSTIAISSVTGPINGAMIDLFRTWALLPNAGRFKSLKRTGSPAVGRMVLTTLFIFSMVGGIYVYGFSIKS